MNNTIQGYHPATNNDLLTSQKYAEIRKLKERCNFVGFMLIIATLVFLAFSFTASYVISLAASMYGNAASGGLFNKSNDSLLTNILSGFCNIVSIGICGAFFVKHLKKDTPNILTFEKVGLKKMIALCIIGFTVCNLSNYMTNIFLDSTFSIGIDLDIESYDYISNTPLEIIVYILSVAIVPAFSEELLFRGAILSALRKYGDGMAVFVSAFFFGLFHGNFIQFPFAFIVGLVQAWTVVYTNSMLPAMIIHFMNNGFSILCDIFYTNANNWQISEEITSIVSILIVIVSAILSVVALAKLSIRDNNFLKLKPYQGLLEKKEINKSLLTSPTIIIAFALLLLEAISVHSSWL